jgi:hypothetical protein
MDRQHDGPPEGVHPVEAWREAARRQAEREVVVARDSVIGTPTPGMAPGSTWTSLLQRPEHRLLMVLFLTATAAVFLTAASTGNLGSRGVIAGAFNAGLALILGAQLYLDLRRTNRTVEPPLPQGATNDPV